MRRGGNCNSMTYSPNFWICVQLSPLLYDVIKILWITFKLVALLRRRVVRGDCKSIRTSPNFRPSRTFPLITLLRNLETLSQIKFITICICTSLHPLFWCTSETFRVARATIRRFLFFEVELFRPSKRCKIPRFF